MTFHFLTLFPEMVLPALDHSIMKRAVEKQAAEFHAINPRNFATDKHRTVDDSPYGGGPGMVLMAPVVEAALKAAGPTPQTAVVLTDPMGAPFTQADARHLASLDHVVFVCGHYEGVDERVRTQLATHTFTIGDYVLTGGELPALVMADSIVRLLPGVLGDPESHQDDSHSDGLLGFPLYTRPLEFNGEKVPEVLTSGNHAAIAKWRRQQQLQRTKSHRPDLFSRARLNPGDLDLI